MIAGGAISNIIGIIASQNSDKIDLKWNPSECCQQDVKWLKKINQKLCQMAKVWQSSQ